MVWGLQCLVISLFDFAPFGGFLCEKPWVAWCGESSPSGLVWCGEYMFCIISLTGLAHFTRISLQRKDRKCKSGMSSGSIGGGHCFVTIVSVLVCRYSILPCESNRRPNILRSDPCEVDSFWFLKIVDPSWFLSSLQICVHFHNIINPVGISVCNEKLVYIK